jgi:hypothetical protein
MWRNMTRILRSSHTDCFHTRFRSLFIRNLRLKINFRNFLILIYMVELVFFFTFSLFVAW